MTSYQDEGIRLRLMPFRDDAALGVMACSTVLALIPDPLREENPAALRTDPGLREHAKLRQDVQRVLRKSAKGRNVRPYADYIAEGLLGERGKAWTTPPLCLWSPEPLTLADDSTATIPLGTPIVAVDSETQLAAWHLLYNEAETYRLDRNTLRRTRIPFELYWGLEVLDAKQLFHDRNLRGVGVSKTLALSMDQHDYGTRLARHITESVKVPGEYHGFDPLSRYVNVISRQIGPRNSEWVTLSAMRSMVVTALLGKSGIEATSGAVEKRHLPRGVTPHEATTEVSAILVPTLESMIPHLKARTAITAPAVLAGIGAVAHQAMPWCSGGRRLTAAEFKSLLADIRWEREARYWEGVVAKRLTNGTLSFGGGAKDSGSKVCDAILNPDSPAGRKIRGRS